jgi:hypothetical protein
MYYIKTSKVIVVAVVALLALECPDIADAGYLKFNTHFKNTTGSMVNDYHVRLEADEPINISRTWEFGGNVKFQSGKVTGDGTNSVVIDWSGATVNQGQTAHCGVSTSNYNPSIRIVESWWTVGGVKFIPNLNDGVQAQADFDGGSGFTVARIELYDDIFGSNVIGTEWIEGPGNLFSISNKTLDGPVFVSVATLASPTEIPIEDLNYSLSGFGPQSVIFELNPVPEPASIMLLGLGGLVMLRRRKA